LFIYTLFGYELQLKIKEDVKGDVSSKTTYRKAALEEVDGSSLESVISAILR